MRNIAYLESDGDRLKESKHVALLTLILLTWRIG